MLSSNISGAMKTQVQQPEEPSQAQQGQNNAQQPNPTTKIGSYKNPFDEKQRYSLYSGHIQPRTDGTYTFYEQACLFNNEALRLATKQIQEALVAFDGSKAWKVNKYFKYYDIYLRAVHYHFKVAEQSFFPAYQAQLKKIQSALTFSENASDAHPPIILLLDEIKALQKNFIDSIANNAPEQIIQLDDNLRIKVNQLQKMINEDLNATERTIIPIIETCGEQFYRTQETKLIQETFQETDQEMIKFFVGLTIVVRCNQKHGWGTDASNALCIKKFPWVARKLSIPKFVKIYYTYHQNLLDLNLSEEPIASKGYCCF